MSRNLAEKEASIEDRFKYYVALPTLQEIACYQVSISMWNKYICSFKPHSFKNDPDDEDICQSAFGFDYDYWDDVDKNVMDLGVPPFISKLIKECNQKVIAETRSWLFHFRSEIMSWGRLNRYMIRNFDPEWCIWSPNGKIDYVKTAAKMVASPGLSKTNKYGLTKAQKFAIMSNYCMEDEIKAFPPPPRNFLEAVNFDSDVLIFYWDCYSQNTLHNVPLDDVNNSIDCFMAKACYFETWAAFEFFWNRLHNEDQSVTAHYRLLFSAVGQEQLFYKMSWSQQLRLLREIPLTIIENFWLSLGMPQAALWAWKYTNDLLTPDQFIDFVIKVFKLKYSDEDEIRLLIEMWDMAPNHLKNQIAKIQDDEMVEIFVTYMGNDPSPSAKKLLLRILSSKEVVSRKYFVLENVLKFFTKVKDFRFMNDVFNLCLPNPELQLNLKNCLLHSEETIKCFDEVMHTTSNFDWMSTFVEFYSLDVNNATEFKKWFIKSIIISKYLPSVDFNKAWFKFSNFIDGCFPKDQLSASNFKRTMISSFAENFQYDWRTTDDFTGIMKFVESVFQNEELEYTKVKLAKSFSRVSTDRDYFWSFLFEKFYEFVSWCFSANERALLEFKNSVFVDSVFDHFFYQMNKTYREKFFGMSLEIYPPLLKNFLTWIFSDAEKVKDYKLKRINESDDMEIFKTLPARRDEKNLEVLLKWFFNDNEAQIRPFRSKKLKTE